MADPYAEHGPEATADASVRIGWPADAGAIAAVQVACWRTHYAGVVPPELLEPDTEAIARHWRTSLTKPPDARNRALVALEAGTIVGFAATGPSEDPDADPIADGAVTALHIDPGHTRRGHGSRLLNAIVDTFRADAFTRATLWIFAGDDPLRSFLGSAGWEPDGAHRQLEVGQEGTSTAKQIRLHCAIPPE